MVIDGREIYISGQILVSTELFDRWLMMVGGGIWVAQPSESYVLCNISWLESVDGLHTHIYRYIVEFLIHYIGERIMA